MYNTLVNNLLPIVNPQTHIRQKRIGLQGQPPITNIIVGNLSAKLIFFILSALSPMADRVIYKQINNNLLVIIFIMKGSVVDTHVLTADEPPHLTYISVLNIYI